MERRSFSREFKVEAVRLVRERGVSVAQHNGLTTVLLPIVCNTGVAHRRGAAWIMAA